MAKTIGTILSLTDKVSPKLITIGRNFDSLDKKQQAMAKSAAYQLNNYVKSMGSAITAASKFAMASAAAVGGVAIKTGLSEAMGLETYRTQLITATKDTQRAAEVMRYAINLANTTPFEGSDMVSAAAVLEMAGMKTEKYLTLLGDVAAGANRSISDVQGAFTKAFNLGDYSALREATGLLLNAESVKAYGLTKGITDQAEALYALLEEKFGGGMAGLAQTTKGAWSTITGATKNALANIMGAANDGTVRTGSVLDKLKGKATDLADTLVRWQSDGTIEALSDKAASGFDKLWTKAEGLFKFVGEHKEIIIGLGAAVIGIGAVTKAVTALNTILTVTKTLSMFVTGALSVSPVGIMAGVAALAAVGTVAATAKSRGAFIDTKNGRVYSDTHLDAAGQYWTAAKESRDVVSWGKNVGNAVKEWGIGLGVGFADWFTSDFWTFVDNSIMRIDERNKAKIDHIKEALGKKEEQDLVSYYKGKSNTTPNEDAQKHTGEKGSWSQGALANNKANRSGNPINISFTINGAGDPERVADMVAGKILEVLDNV